MSVRIIGSGKLRFFWSPDLSCKKTVQLDKRKQLLQLREFCGCECGHRCHGNRHIFPTPGNRCVLCKPSLGLLVYWLSRRNMIPADRIESILRQYRT